MRNKTDIFKTPGIVIKKEGKDCFGGSVFPVYYKKGKAKIDNSVDKVLHFIFSVGCGFEHLSVSTPVRTPTWDEMCKMKDIFWNEDEVCMQLHPAKEDYVDNMPYCLHIWRPIVRDIPMPPSIMVGMRKGKEAEDALLLARYGQFMPRWEDETDEHN